MSLKEWLFSTYPSPHIEGQWGLLHIIVLVCSIIFIVASTLILKSKNQKAKRIVLFILVSIIFAFGVTRRVINFAKATEFTTNSVLRTLLPRPGCAISCWLVILATIINKKSFYNFASIIGILCGIIFFAYPGAGFNNTVILFEDLYSIATHTLFFISSICFITYGFTNFRYKECWKEGIYFFILFVYVMLEIYVLKTESDPFYFMPNNEVQEIIPIDYSLYLPIYIIFMIVYVNLFYLIHKPKKLAK
jgi:hypothetical protein